MHSDSLKMTVGNLKIKSFFVLVHVIIANIRIFISFSAYAPLDLLLFFLWSAHLFHMFYFITGFFLFLRPKCSPFLALFIFWQAMKSFISTRLVYGVLFLQHCGGLTLAEHQVPTKQLYHSPPQQDKAGEKIKLRKTSCAKIKGV